MWKRETVILRFDTVAFRVEEGDGHPADRAFGMFLFDLYSLSAMSSIHLKIYSFDAKAYSYPYSLVAVFRIWGLHLTNLTQLQSGMATQIQDDIVVFHKE